MSNFRYFVYGILLTACVWAFPVEATFKCSQFKAMLPEILTSGYGFLATADGPVEGMAIAIFLARDGKYKIIGIDANLEACPLIEGTNWAFALQQGI